jgi:hypothetical protein
MIDYQNTHRCLLTDVASGDITNRGKSSQTVQALLLAGFLSSKKTCHADGSVVLTLTLTPVGHRYLAGLWH